MGEAQVLATWKGGLSEYRLVGRGSGMDVEFLNTDRTVPAWVTLTGDDRRFQVVAQELARQIIEGRS